jgi:transposase
MSRSLYGIILVVPPDGACLVSLLPDEHLLVCVSVERLPGGYRVELEGAAAGCACPKCGVVSRRVHARYARRVHDLPVQGERVIIRLEARKFRCDNRGCARRVFCERFGSVIPAFARMTERFEAALQTMALLVSARLAERIGHALGYWVSASTLLRLAHRYQPPWQQASAIGVDDFAFRRSHTYGTIIVDLATNRPIELLRDRSAESLTAYLEAHPEVRLVARDRDAAYAHAITHAAPAATVVIDRWHLLRNLSDAFERLVVARSTAWRKALQAHANAQHASASDETSAPGGGPPPPERNRGEQRERPATAARTARRQHLLERAHDLREKGWTKLAIARQLKLDPKTVTAYLELDTAPDYSRRHPTPASLDEHHEHLRARWREGCRNAAHLTRELTDRGYRGSERTVRRHLQHWRGSEDAPHGCPSISPPIVTLPSPRKLAWNLLHNESDATTRALLEHVPDAEHHTNLTLAGLDAIKHHNPHAWNAWTAAILEQPNSPLRRFVTGLNRDHHAITNALTLTYSNGPTEGNVNRLKLIKRTMYGRASFELLRKKVLYQSARAPPDQRHA